MDEDQFAWLGSIFYLGFLVCQVKRKIFITLRKEKLNCNHSCALK